MSYVPPKIPNCIQAADPDLNDVLAAWKQDILLSLNCHALATVTACSQDATTGRLKIDATINYSKTQWVQVPGGTFEAKQLAYPPLQDCPALVIGGGGTALQMPVAAGDQCLILFNDRDLNNWWAGASGGPVASARAHSFSDAIALIGFNTMPVVDSSKALLTNGNAQLGVDVSGALVTLQNENTSLLIQLNTLKTALNNFFTTASTATTAAQIAAAAGTAHGALGSVQFEEILE